MMFPRSSVQLAAIALSFFCSFIWFLGGPTVRTRFSRQYQQDAAARNALSFIATEVPPVPFDEPAHDPIRDIQNATLGFQKIYVISMPSRTDKRDFLALMGLVSGLELTFADGVNGSDMHPSSFPAYWRSNKALGDYGCWRAHMNVYQDMVQKRIQTALIIEDDADWDVLLRYQLAEFARGARAIQNATISQHSPYGDNWYLLSLGHNGGNNRLNKIQKYWVAHNDPTVIAESRRTYGRKPDLSTPKLAGAHTRFVMAFSKFTATGAYGISLKGAAMMLYDQALMPNAQAIDMAMLTLCRYDPFNSPFCIGAYPMIFGRYRGIGPVSKDSDRRTSSNEADPGTGGFQADKERLKPESEFTVFSVGLNLLRLMRGEHVIPANDPETDLIKELDLTKILFPRGHQVVVAPEEYEVYQAALKERKKQEEAKEQGEKAG